MGSVLIRSVDVTQNKSVTPRQIESFPAERQHVVPVINKHALDYEYQKLMRNYAVLLRDWAVID